MVVVMLLVVVVVQLFVALVLGEALVLFCRYRY